MRDPPANSSARRCCGVARRGGDGWYSPRIMTLRMHELADVARPAVIGAESCVDPALDFLRESLGVLGPGDPLDDRAHERASLAGLVVELLAQRWGADQIAAKAVIEVSAEAARLHLNAEIAVRRADNLPPERTIARVA